MRTLHPGCHSRRHIAVVVSMICLLAFTSSTRAGLLDQWLQDKPAHENSGHGGSHALERRADKHAPAGLMGEHVHKRGSWMIEYKYMNMYMDDNLYGKNKLTDAQALTVGQSLGTNFGATPTSMTMEMHMLHWMYGLTDNVTVYVMPMLSSLTMDHIRGPMNPAPQGPGSPFTTHNSGFDDTGFGFLWRVYQGCTDELVFNVGCTVPTGNIDRESAAPTGGVSSLELPYPMRRGSGTFDARPGVTYRSVMDHGSFGAQFQTDLPIGRNWDDYSLGDEFRLNFWYAHLLTDRLALSFRVESLWRDNINGADPGLNPMVISTARPDMRGGEWINFGYGVMVLVGKGHLLNFEAVQPVYQHVDGIQLETDWALFVSWSKSF